MTFDVRRRWAWPLIAALLLVGGVLAALLGASLAANDGHLVYALDDAYIHMAMARHFAEDGVWGLTRYEFSSSSSSPLWTLLLAATYRLTGVNELAPFILNLLCLIAVVWIAYRLLRKSGAGPGYVFLWLAAMIFITGLPALAFTGMEHLLHVALVLAFADQVLKCYRDAPSGDSKSLQQAPSRPAPTEVGLLRGGGPLIGLSFVLTAVRYESLFLIFLAGLLLALRGRWRTALVMVGVALLPPLAYGLASVSHGWSWLPNSLIVKGRWPALTDVRSIAAALGYAGLWRSLADPNTALLLLLAGAAYVLQWSERRTMWSPEQRLLLLFATATVAHMQYARSATRYLSYLVALGLVACALAAAGFCARHLTWAALRRRPLGYGVGLAALVAVALLGNRIVPGLPYALISQRGYRYNADVPRSTTNIYQQQYQMGLFLAEFYPGQVVAANDVGAISFLADVKTLDLWGLGSREVGQAIRQGDYGPQRIYEIAASSGAKIAVVFDRWFNESYGGLPAQWIKVRTWTIPHNIVCGDATVSFYALTPAEAERLAAALEAFAPRLPGEVMDIGIRY